MLWQSAIGEGGFMFERLDKVRSDLKRAQAKRDEWDNKVKALQKKCAELEKTCIHEMMVAADLTPEQLANLIAYSKDNLPGNKPIEEIANTNISKEEDFDEEDEN